jgi:hypothetical protein
MEATQSAEIENRNRQQAARSDENRADRSPNIYTAQTKPKITRFLRVSSCGGIWVMTV